MSRKKKRKVNKSVDEPCLQNNRVCSEGQVKKRDNIKAMDKTKIDRGRPDHDVDNKSLENGLIGKAFSLNIIQDMIDKEVTWTAVAAIGGATIIIWNIIRYTFILFSSLMLHIMTNVPMYLLMMRKNIGFTDGYIFYGTIFILLCIINPMKNERKKVLKKIAIPSLIVLTISLIFCVTYILSAFWYAPGYNIFANDTYWSFHIFTITRILLIVEMPMLAFPIDPPSEIDKSLESEKPVKQSKVHDENLTKQENSFLSIPYRVMLVLSFAFWFVVTAVFPTKGLLDQDGRFIVADLGDQYIVQTAVYDCDEYKLTIDTSRYYVIDSSKETVEVIKIFYNGKQ